MGSCLNGVLHDNHAKEFEGFFAGDTGDPLKVV